MVLCNIACNTVFPGVVKVCNACCVVYPKCIKPLYRVVWCSGVVSVVAMLCNVSLAVCGGEVVCNV